MKNNNLFRKFLALFLTGTMLAGVGCKDYDDDIDDINKKIDDLNAKVELKADASALQTISDKLKDVDFSKFVTTLMRRFDVSSHAGVWSSVTM